MNFDEAMLNRLKRMEREVERLRVKERPAGESGVTDHGALTGLSDDDHPQYLLTTAKAADSDKLDGLDSTAFATAGHDHNADYLGISAKAADSDKLDGLNSTDFGRPVWLANPLTSSEWVGQLRTSVGKTLIDLSEVFGCPAGIKAVYLWVGLSCSDSYAGNANFIMAGNSTPSDGISVDAEGLNNGKFERNTVIIPCDENGDIYYQISATGTGLSIYMRVYGYWL